MYLVFSIIAFMVLTFINRLLPIIELGLCIYYLCGKQNKRKKIIFILNSLIIPVLFFIAPIFDNSGLGYYGEYGDMFLIILGIFLFITSLFIYLIKSILVNLRKDKNG